MTTNDQQETGPTAKAWIVPKIPHDEHVAITPYVMPDRTINRTKGNSTPAHARHYAAQLLAAADEADRLAEKAKSA